MNYREWSNPNNWDDDGNWRGKTDSPREITRMWFDEAQRLFIERPLYADEETIDLYVDYLERQIGVEFSPEEIEWLHSVGMKP